MRGHEGKLIVQNDARRHVFGRLERAPTSGGSLELTIDEGLQYIAERELRAGVEEKRADGGSVVILDPQTAEILALASWPTFNPNALGKVHDPGRRNRAVQDIYEPGSTFKVVTIAAALEEHVMSVDTLIDTSPGVYRMQGRVIDEFEGHNYGVLSLTDVIVKSSNVGAVKIGLRVGKERMGLYANRFGFGRPTSPDFPGESPGILWSPDRLNESGLASMAMGYQVGVTPLQMVAAMNAVANGGTWIQPRIVRAVTRDGVRTRVEPKAVRRVISPETVQQMLPDPRSGGRARDREARARVRIHRRRQDRHCRQARERPLRRIDAERVVPRLRAVASSGVDGHRDDRYAARRIGHGRCGRGTDLQAHRRSGAAPPGRAARHQS